MTARVGGKRLGIGRGEGLYEESSLNDKKPGLARGWSQGVAWSPDPYSSSGRHGPYAPCVQQDKAETDEFLIHTDEGQL